MKSPLHVYSVPDETTSPKFAEAFAQGCGGVVKYQYELGEWSGFGSPKNLCDVYKTIQNGFDFFYGDHAYFKRFKFYRVTKNAFFHSGEGVSNMQRIKMFYDAPAPWKRGRKIILCPQSDAFFIRLGTTQFEWIRQTTKNLRKFTDRRIIVHRKTDRTPLEAFLTDAHCVVSHSSNSAVEAIMAGVPAINTAPSHAALMCRRDLSDVENLLRPDNRLEWAAVLADNQWTFEEMRSGICWQHLQENQK